jgi:hypothetical protein
MSRILTPVGWREINEEVELEEDVLTEEELEFATEEIVNALNVLIDYDIIDESALNELSPSTLSSYAKKAADQRRRLAKAVSPYRKTVAKLKSDISGGGHRGDEAHRRLDHMGSYWEKDIETEKRKREKRNQGLAMVAKRSQKRLPS